MSQATAFRELDAAARAPVGGGAPPAEGGVRQGERRSLRKPARLRGSAGLVTVRALNVGAGGMAVVAPFNPVVGTRSFIHFDLPIRDQGLAELGLGCSVAHSIYSHRESGFVVGLRFEEVSESAERLLQRYLHA